MNYLQAWAYLHGGITKKNWNQSQPGLQNVQVVFCSRLRSLCNFICFENSLIVWLLPKCFWIFPRNFAESWASWEALRLSRKRVLTKMECLDFCLRNETCDFFELRQVLRLNKKRKHWICAIKRRLTSSYIDTKLIRVRKWIHFNVTSHYLHQVSFAALSPTVATRCVGSWFKKFVRSVRC